MINRLGVKPSLCLVALTFALLSVAGCASAPIAMQAEQDSSLMQAQVQLREQAVRLADRLESAGWAVTATPADATRSFFGRLIGGAETVEEESPDAVATYLTSADFSQVEGDLLALKEEAEALADQTLIVASSDGSLEAESLVSDLAAVERALGAVRRANRFFGAVTEDDSWSEDSLTALRANLEGVGSMTTRLETAADALAERRWASRSGLFG